MANRVLPRFTMVLAFCLCLAGIACGPRREPLFPVQGKVLLEGKPTPGALVVFHREPQDPLNPITPAGVVGSDGTFQLTTGTEQGAPAGSYLVAISWIPENAKPHPDTGDVPNKLPAHYADPRQSGLRAEVKEGNNELPVFHLKRR
jgi:hypothetical protein